MRKITRKALTRGTAVHLGANKVMFVWPCGCLQTRTFNTSDGGALSHTSVALLVKNWRLNGVELDQCQEHPDWYSRFTQVPRLNAEHPQVEVKYPKLVKPGHQEQSNARKVSLRIVNTR